MQVFWTLHAEERQREWEKILGITRSEVEAVVTNPEQVVPGDVEAQVAQSRREHGLIRVPFVEIEGGRRILTIYWTSKVERYWRGAPDAGSI